MNLDEQKKFTQGLIVLAEIYNRKLSSLLLETYWNCLKPYSFASFETALSNFLRNPDYAKKGFPSTAEWIKAIDGDSETKSLAAWTEVIQAIRYVGQYDSVAFNDPLIHLIIKEMGGWIFLCQQPQRELIFLQKEFERRYRHSYTIKNLSTVPPYLTGKIEHQNAVHGFTEYIPEPINVSIAQASHRNIAYHSATEQVSHKKIEKEIDNPS